MITKQDVSIKKAGGFYTGICGALLSIAAAAMYGINFKSISYKEPVFDSKICIFLIITACLSVLLLLVQKLDGFAPVLLCAGSGISFLLYGKMMIWPISDTIYGIEPFPYINEVIICAVLLVVSFIFSEISLYMRKTKEVKTEDKKTVLKS